MPSIKQKKVMAVDSTIYTATYFGLMKVNKKKFRLTQADQFELLYKTMLIIAIQFFFIMCILFLGKVSFKMKNNVALQFCLFFTTLLLHLGNLPLFRSGLYMMKYSMCHPEQFTHPKLAFMLGFIYMFTLIISEWINVAKGT